MGEGRRGGRRRRVVAELLDGGVNRAAEAKRQGGGARRGCGAAEAERQGGGAARLRREEAERKWSCSKATTARLLGNCGAAGRGVAVGLRWGGFLST